MYQGKITIRKNEGPFKTYGTGAQTYDVVPNTLKQTYEVWLPNGITPKTLKDTFTRKELQQHYRDGYITTT